MIATKSQIKYTLNLFIERKRKVISDVYKKYDSIFDYLTIEDYKIIEQALSDIEMFSSFHDNYK